MRRATVLLADDHAIVTDGLISLLKERFDVVGAVANGNHLVSEAIRLRPDVIVADISMPELSGLEALRQLRAKHFAPRVIFLTMYADAHLAVEAVRGGASGYVLKHSAGEELLTAIEQVLKGHTYLTPVVVRDVVAGLGVPDDRVELTSRQREVLRLIVEGRRMKEIAEILKLSPRTVETHKYELTRALGVQSTAELIRYAIEHKLVIL
jgi:two-component system, NarL family, response regulator NreC